MRKISFLIVIVFFNFQSCIMCISPHLLEGRVVTKELNESIYAVKIISPSEKDTVLSDSNGLFKINCFVKSGNNCTLETNYKSKNQKITFCLDSMYHKTDTFKYENDFLTIYL